MASVRPLERFLKTISGEAVRRHLRQCSDQPFDAVAFVAVRTKLPEVDSGRGGLRRTVSKSSQASGGLGQPTVFYRFPKVSPQSSHYFQVKPRAVYTSQTACRERLARPF